MQFLLVSSLVHYHSLPITMNNTDTTNSGTTGTYNSGTTGSTGSYNSTGTTGTSAGTSSSRLPKTASDLPTVALAGLLALCAAFAIRVYSKRNA